MASEWLKLTAYLSDVFAVSHQNSQAGCDHVNPILIYQGVHCCTKVCNLLQTERVVIQPESSGCVNPCIPKQTSEEDKSGRMHSPG